MTARTKTKAYTFRCEWIKCGKNNCRTCPHGPYWYGYWRDGDKMRKRYFGREDPRDRFREREGDKTTAPKEERHPWEAVFSKATVSAALCYDILGLTPGVTWERVALQYKHLALIHHPDRGGDGRMMAYINSAYTYLRWVHQR